MVLTEIGEIGIHNDGRQYVLRPSLYAMTQIGDPKEIVQVYANVMADDALHDQFDDALVVLYACLSDDADLFGGVEVGGYVAGAVPMQDIIPLARCLLKHGVTGALPPLPRKADSDPEYTSEFDARAHVSLAIAHLGMSSKEAWQMTMTELVGAMRAKFPQETPGSRAPSLEEHDATMAWFDQIEAARAKAQGAH